MSRPEKPIDWDKVEQLLLAGATGVEIAPHFDLHYDTFYTRFKDYHGVGFTVYCSSRFQQGNGLLKLKSFQKAMRGDNTQLTLNLKNRCGYHEGKHDQEVPNDKYLNILIEELKSLKELNYAPKPEANPVIQ